MGALFSLVLVYNKQLSHKQENKHVLISTLNNIVRLVAIKTMRVAYIRGGGGACCNKFVLF
jgi:hypothetical protein